MPIATIQIVAGRDAAKKRKLMAAVTEAIASSLDAPIDSVKVIVHEIPADLWSTGGQTVAEKKTGREGNERA